MSFELFYAQVMPNVEGSLLLPTEDQDVELLAPPAPVCLHTAVLITMVMDQTSKTVSQVQLNIFLYESYPDHGVSSQLQKP